MVNSRLCGLFLSASGLLVVPEIGLADESESENDARSTLLFDEIVVTGTRLRTGDFTARIDVMTHDDIEARGLATTEDVLRAIPQNYIGFGNFNNNEQLFTLGNGLPAGTQLANLRGLGAENTLVLVNGRRRAGVAGDDNGFVNLANIPAAMIERVEVLLGGGSAIYGSDSIGGVINFITKKDYEGISARARYDHSGTGGHKLTGMLSGGHAWGGGSFSGTFGYQDVQPVRNASTGWTTSDYRYLFDADPGRFIGNRDDYDNRNDTFGQPGWVRLQDGALVSLPPDNDGIGAIVADFVDISDPAARDTFRNDDVPIFSGTDSETYSINGNVAQELSDKITLRSEFDWSRVESWAEKSSTGNFVDVPASNAFNPFGQDVQVRYLPSSEVAAGLLPKDFDTTTNEIVNFNLGVDYALPSNTVISTTFLFSESSAKGSARRFAGNSSGNDQLAEYEAKINEILANPDPAQTVNLFGDGSAQTELISEFFTELFDRDERTRIRQLDVHWTGSGIELPAGRVNFVLGGELRSEELLLPDDSADLAQWTGGTTPERRSRALFAELSIPLISGANPTDFARLLTLNLQVRYDSYRVEGADGSDANGDPNLLEAKFSATSPRVGIAYQPIDDLVIRAAWSEGFRAPTFERLFDANPLPDFFATLPFLRFFDPLAPGGPVEVRTGLIREGNPNLRPEQSTQWDLGFTWAPGSIPGLSVSAAYSDIDYRDRIVSGGALFRDLPPEFLAPREDLVIRDDDGNAITQVWTPVNEYRRVSKDLTIDVNYRFESRWGEFEPGINYSRILQLNDQYSPEVDPVDLVGTSRGLDDYRVRARIGWYKGRWSAMLGIHYTPSYLNDQVEIVFGTPESFHNVDSYTTVDLTAALELDNGLTIRAGGRNITDTSFPYAILDSQIAGSKPYDPSRVDPFGRVIFLELTFDTSRIWKE